MKVIISYHDINGEDKSVLVDIDTPQELAVAVNTIAQGGNFISNVNIPRKWK